MRLPVAKIEIAPLFEAITDPAAILVDPDDEMLNVVPEPSIDRAGVAVLDTINEPPEIEMVEPL